MLRLAAMRLHHVLLACLIAGCASNSPSGPDFIKGFNPPKPGPHEVQFVIPPIKAIPPGADVTYCTYLDYKAPKDLDITNYVGYQSELAGHHILLYAVSNSQAANTHICNEDDMINARYLAGGGKESPPAVLPEGIVLRIPANTQLMIQSHWINSSDSPVDGQAAFNVDVEDADPSHVLADLFTVPGTMFDLKPGDGEAQVSCTVQQDMNFFLMGGHEHEWGTHVSMTVTPAGGGTPNMIYDTPWQPSYQSNPPRNQYTKDQPFTLHQGDTLSVDCKYYNDTGSDIVFPREMCVGWGYYFPATREIDCTDGNWGS